MPINAERAVFMNYNQYYPFETMQLTYDYDGLEPAISKYTMFFHYNEHYIPALEKLNKMVLEIPLNQNIPLEQLTKSDDIDLRRTAGNVYTHEMHFSSLTDKESKPSEYLTSRLTSGFGSPEKFLEELKNKAALLYGSGGIWLCENKSGKLSITLTEDHETPDILHCKPIFYLDLWEHGYYLDRQNHRKDYVEAALKHINWQQLEKNLLDYSYIAI